MRSLHLLALLPLLFSCSKDEASDAVIETGDTFITDSGPPVLPVDDSIELIRDDKGVPHIYANTRRGVYYGLGYASAQDRMFQMDFVRRKAGGTLTEFFWLDGEDDFNDALVDSDIMMRTLGHRQHAERVVQGLPKEKQLELMSFADGVNAYLKTLTQLPQLYTMRGVGEIAPWTEADSILAWDHGAVFQGNTMREISKEIIAWSDCSDPSSEDCSPACIRPNDDDSAIIPEEASINWPDRGRESRLPQADRQSAVPFKEMSHGWAVAGDRIDSGKPVLAFDPKIPVWAPSLFYPFHLSGPDLEVRGMGFPGAPALLAFWNEHLGQTITSTAGDMTDLFEMSPGSDADHYMLDGVEQEYILRVEVIQRGDGTTHTFTVKESIWGPVINEIPALAESNSTKDILARAPDFCAKNLVQTQSDNHSVIAAMEANRATTLDEFRAAHSNWFTPYTHTIYAGVDEGKESGNGNIAYHHTSGVPWRVSQEIGGLDYTGQHPLDGSDSGNDWTGMMTMDERPHVIDPSSGYILAANHLTVGAWYQDFAYSGTTSYSGETFRSLILRGLLEGLLDGGATVSADDVHLIHESNNSYVTDTLRLALEYLIQNRGQWGSPPAAGQSPSTDEEKVHKVREALEAYAANGSEFVESNPYEDLVVATTQGLKSQTYAESDAFKCDWNRGTTAANWISRTLRADMGQALTDHPELVGFVFDTALRVYASSAWQDDDIETWTEDTPSGFDVAFGYFGTQCSVPTESSNPSNSECSLNQDHVLHYDSIERHNKNQISSASDSSMPGSVDFSDVNAAQWLFPIGVSEDPTSQDFDSFLPQWENYAQAGPTASTYVQAPLERSLITIRDITALEYWE
jgi:acyl-homoserine lactone acylase PvdQ